MIQQLVHPPAFHASMISDVKVVDNYTIQLITDEPFGPFLAQLATYNAAILSQKPSMSMGTIMVNIQQARDLIN